MAVQTQIQTRRGTAASWTSTNPTLAAGEIGFESDTNKFKIGTGSTAWVSLAYASNVSPLTTKGDLYTFSTTNARLAVGSNGETIVADSSTATGLRYQVPIQANPVINSAFQVFQRGTSFTIASTAVTYTADRWACNRNATGMTVTQQNTNDTTNLPFILKCLRVARDSGNTSTTQLQTAQSIETVNSIAFAGRTVTFSFYARAGANYSATSNALTVQLIGGTGTDQGPYSYTGTTTPVNTTATLTTTWQRFSFTGSVGATVTELATRFFFDPTGTAGAADFFEVTGVQVEIGSVATLFKTNGATIQGELAACQRYYAKSYAQATAPATATTYNNAIMYSMPFNWAADGDGRMSVRFPVVMRGAPTLTIYSSNNGATGNWYNESQGINVAAGVQYLADSGYSIYLSATSNQKSVLTHHYAANAEL